MAFKPKQKKKQMTKAMYRMQMLGIAMQFMRSLMFNAFMLVLGICIGMGFSIMHIDKAWKERCLKMKNISI